MNVSIISGLFSKKGKKSLNNTGDMNAKFLQEFHNMILNYVSRHPSGAKHFPYFTDMNGGLPTMEDVMTWFDIVYASIEGVSSEDLTILYELLSAIQELQLNTINSGYVNSNIRKLLFLIKEKKQKRGIEIYNRFSIA